MNKPGILVLTYRDPQLPRIEKRLNDHVKRNVAAGGI